MVINENRRYRGRGRAPRAEKTYAASYAPRIPILFAYWALIGLARAIVPHSQSEPFALAQIA